MIDTDLVAYLLGQPAIVALIGDRIYPQGAEAGARRPFVNYRRVGREGFRTLDGPAKPTIVRFQFECWGGTNAEARSLADTLRQVLDGFTGLWGTTTISNVSYDDDTDDRDDQWTEFCVTASYGIFYDEVPIPTT